MAKIEWGGTPGPWSATEPKSALTIAPLDDPIDDDLAAIRAILATIDREAA